MLKKLSLIAILVTLASPANAQYYTNGYVTGSGQYVSPYVRTAPDSNPYNNYSTYGNYNPYTGAYGTVQPNTQIEPQQYYDPSVYGGRRSSYGH